MTYLLAQKNGDNRNDGCYDLDQARVILLGKLMLENQIYGVDLARKYRKDHGLQGDLITDQNIERWARYYGFSFHRIDSSSWAKISKLLDKKPEKRKTDCMQLTLQLY